MPYEAANDTDTRGIKLNRRARVVPSSHVNIRVPFNSLTVASCDAILAAVGCLVVRVSQSQPRMRSCLLAVPAPRALCRCGMRALKNLSEKSGVGEVK